MALSIKSLKQLRESISEMPVFESELARLMVTEDIINEFRQKLKEVPESYDTCDYTVKYLSVKGRAITCYGAFYRSSGSRDVWDFARIKVKCGKVTRKGRL